MTFSEGWTKHCIKSRFSSSLSKFCSQSLNIFFQTVPLQSPSSSYLPTVATQWRHHGLTWRWWCHMMAAIFLRRCQDQKCCCFSYSIPVPRCVLFNYLCYISEWQLRATHAVVGEPTEVVLPSDDIHSYSHVLLVCALCLLLCLWHGSEDSRAGA